MAKKAMKRAVAVRVVRAKNPVKKTGAKVVALTTAKAEHELSVSERAKIKKLLLTKTLEPVSLGLTLLESTGATPADWEAIFTPQIFTSLLNSWVPEIWELVGKSLESYSELSTSFQTLALERYRTRPRKQENFDGLLLARKGVCRPAFVKRWSADEQPRAFMEFILIPAGSFTMGSPEKEKCRNEATEKQVGVTITRAFELGKTVVTQKQWTEVMGTDPWNWENYKETGDNYPAVYVSWLDASLFCKHLTSYEREAGRLSANQTYRLPTEAEWEYACRAGTTTAYSFGDAESSLSDYAWYYENSKHKLQEVATKKPNPWGLFDMHGNVWEWCKDWYGVKLSGGTDPVGPGGGSDRVLRGGRWGPYGSRCRSAGRDDRNPAYRDYTNGFRIVRVLLKKAASQKNPAKKLAKNPVQKAGALKTTPKKKSAPSQPVKAVPDNRWISADAALTAAKAEHALSFSERAKIKKLLRTKTLEPVSLGLTLLESTAATPADWEAIFTPQFCTSLLNSWVPEIWELVGKSLEPYCELSASFQTLAMERYRKRPREHCNFEEVLFPAMFLARKAVCRPAFVKRWSASEHPRAFMDFISIPAGSFTMGSPEKEKDRGDDEKQVPVTITRAFELGKTVVTQKQWTEVMGTDPWNWENDKETGDNYPAVYVTWDDASLFCECLTSYEREAGRLSEKQTYRLPTEAEWEYACRAGTTTAYSRSSLGGFAWYNGKKLHEVATKKPNPWGLFDMHGNVYEWCEDWYEDSLSGGNDPKGPSDGKDRVLRGGDWWTRASNCRSAARSSHCFVYYDRYQPSLSRFGFRIVRVLL